MQLESLKIKNLFGRTNVTLRFDENRLILVGENGSGKSTSLSLLYYFLTKQWGRLAELQFDAAELRIGGTDLRLSVGDLREDLMRSRSRMAGAWGFIRRRIPASIYEQLVSKISQRPTQYWLSGEHLRELSLAFGVEHEVLLDAVLSEDHPQSLGRKERSKAIPRVEEALTKHVDVQVLFLPTYRRIERDLQYIFPGIRIEQTKRFQRANREAGGYVELVEFGMKDVEEAFASAMQTLDREFRADLNRLTGEYLRDVLRGEHQKADYAAMLPASAGSIDAVLTKLGDDILPKSDRDQLKTLVSQVQSKAKVPKGKEVAAHFLSMLVRIHEQQQSRESRVQQLCNICNEYMTGKKLRFDPLHFKLGFVLDGSDLMPLGPDSLSSGEKQIASLFTHILLSGSASKYLVIIDEPELSISVEWQKIFLPHILATGLCEGLVAVTHSPFMFENSLAKFAHSMSEFIG